MDRNTKESWKTEGLEQDWLFFLDIVAENGFSTNEPAFQPQRETKEERSCYTIIILFICAVQTLLVK